jgi:guanosine-3',5'-bis(diphosphate) 3'-pyrophosphohydrolase
MTQLAAAIKLATELHDGQLDKAGLPYILHPLRVMDRVRQKLTAAGREVELDLLIAAVLHDTIEDTDIFPERIRDEFGDRVFRIVLTLTRIEHPEKETYSEMIQRIALDPDAVIVKDADLDDNLSRIDQLPPAEQDIARRYHKAKTVLAGKF